MLTGEGKREFRIRAGEVGFCADRAIKFVLWGRWVVVRYSGEAGQKFDRATVRLWRKAGIGGIRRDGGWG